MRAKCARERCSVNPPSQAQIAAIGTVADTYEEGREQGLKSTAAISQLARDARKQVKYLNAIARNLYKDQPEQLCAWESASHVERDPQHAATPVPAPTSTGTTATKTTEVTTK